MARGISHGAPALGVGLPATSTTGHPCKTGAWRCGKQNPFPTSPHPRRRLRTKVKRGVTLTFYLVQNIGQVSIVSAFTTTNWATAVLGQYYQSTLSDLNFRDLIFRSACQDFAFR